ncbi:MAG TPA: DUF4233 domain-containing protein [Streptosporangiaceae bacterium]|nr:DUF4233 domain-containing protein [Streptosporangiaceae bacterium]
MKQLRQLCGTVLIMEAVVIGLAIPVAIVMEHLRHGVAGGVGGGLAVCALVLGGLVGRPGMGWALWAGTILQALVIAAGVVVPAMYVLGVIFAALWVTGIWLARHLQTPPPPVPTTRAVAGPAVAGPGVSVSAIGTPGPDDAQATEPRKPQQSL